MELLIVTLVLAIVASVGQLRDAVISGWDRRRA